MANVKRVVNTSFWEDKKVMEKFTPEDKYFFLYLLTNPKTTQIGIYEFKIKYAALELGYSEDTIKGLLDRFENVHKVIKRSGDEIAIKNFLVHSILKGGKPVEDCLRKELKKVIDKNLVLFIKDSIIDKDDINETVKKFLEEIDKASLEGKKATKPSKPKHKYGEYKNVLLTDDELAKIKSDFTNAEELVTYLDEYIEMKGYKAKSHYLAIKKWVVDAVKPKENKSYQQKDKIDWGNV